MRFSARNILTVALALVLAPVATYAVPRCGTPPPIPQATGSPTGSQVQSFANSVQSLIGFLQNLAGNNASQQALVADLQAQFNSLTSDQLTMTASNYDIGAFSNAVTNIVNAQPSNRTQPPSDPPANLFNPNFSICTLAEGQSFGGVIQVPSDPAIISPLDAAIEIAQTAKDIADRLCDLIVVALGGTNAPGCIAAEVTDLILDGLKKAKDVLTFCDPPVKTAEAEATWQNTMVIDTDVTNGTAATSTHLNQIDNHLSLIDSELSSQNNSVGTTVNANIASIGVNLANSISGVDADVDNRITGTDTDLNTHLTSVDGDVTNGDTQINTGINTFQALNVRVNIERALSQGVVIGLFEVPQANGGYLETVQAIVLDTINKILATGGTVGQASKYFSAGNTAFASKQYKTAYSDYLSAYQSAIH